MFDTPLSPEHAALRNHSLFSAASTVIQDDMPAQIDSIPAAPSRRRARVSLGLRVHWEGEVTRRRRQAGFCQKGLFDAGCGSFGASLKLSAGTAPGIGKKSGRVALLARGPNYSVGQDTNSLVPRGKVAFLYGVMGGTHHGPVFVPVQRAMPPLRPSDFLDHTSRATVVPADSRSMPWTSFAVRDRLSLVLFILYDFHLAPPSRLRLGGS